MWKRPSLSCVARFRLLPRSIGDIVSFLPLHGLTEFERWAWYQGGHLHHPCSTTVLCTFGVHGCLCYLSFPRRTQLNWDANNTVSYEGMQALHLICLGDGLIKDVAFMFLCVPEDLKQMKRIWRVSWSGAFYFLQDKRIISFEQHPCVSPLSAPDGQGQAAE